MPNASVARRIVEANMYMTIATADADGRPWVSPVWYAATDDVLAPATARLYLALAGSRFVLGPDDECLPVKESPCA